MLRKTLAKKLYLSSMLLAVFLAQSTHLYAFDIQNLGVTKLKKTILQFENQLAQSNNSLPSTKLVGIDAWIDDSSLNWSNSNIENFKEQKLSFELKLKNSEQIRTEQQILNMGQTRVNLKLTTQLEKRLNYVYSSFIDYIEETQHAELLEEQRRLANAELNSWKLQVNSNTFRADKLQQADLTLDGIWAEQLENNATLKHYTPIKNTQKQLLTNLISLPQMIIIADDIAKKETYQQYSLQIRKSTLSATMFDKQRQREEAQKRISLNSLKLEYDKKDNNVGVSIGVSMPITKNNYESILQAQQQHYINMDAQNVVTEVSQLLKEKKFELLKLQNHWSSNQKLLYRIKQKIKQLSDSNDIELHIALKKKYLQTKIRQQSTYTSALRKYIDYLNTAGMLSAKPYRNWIQAGVPQIL